MNLELLYFQATQITGDLDGILDRSPSTWEPFVRGIQTHELACHHEGVLDPVPAAQIAARLQRWLSMTHDQWMPEVAQRVERKSQAVNTVWA